MDRDDDPSALAWLWVIEALLTSKEITTPTLQGFIDAAPVGHHRFSKNTKELVALRCLEKLSTLVVDPEASSNLDSRFGFNVLGSCQDVLKEILGKIPLSNLKVAGAELLKWDICPFIKHKRAVTFKCHLEQLRESIFKNTHPDTDYLKETTRLFPQNSSRVCSKRSRVCSADETDLPSKRSWACSADETDHARNGYGVEISGDIVSQGEKINLETKKQAEQNLSLKCNEEDRLLICDANVVQPVVPEYVMTTTIIPHHTSVAEPCNNTSMDETDNTAHHAIPTNDANAENNQHIINFHQPKQTEPDITSLNLSQKPVASDKTVFDMVNGCRAELSSDSDGYHNGKNDLEAKKHEFLCSPCTVDQDFSAMTESIEQNLRTVDQVFSSMTESIEQNLCMKCHEGGQLLACKTTTCPLMVHKNCLGASAQLDAKGNFFCPFCAYSHAISEYLESKENASLARKELAIFISKGKLIQAAEFVHEFHRQEHCFSRKNSKCEHIHVKNNEDDQLAGCEDNREDHVGEHANEANDLQFERSKQQAEVLREEEIGKMPTVGRVEESEVPTDHVDGHVGDKFASEKTNIAPESNAEEVPQEMTKQHNIDGTIEPVCAQDTGKEKISEDESEKHSNPLYSLRFRKHETQCKPQAGQVFLGNQLRRKKIPWTAEEEEKIKKFGKEWKKILQFGSHVFDKVGKRRTPHDLKDKWRNMCKAHSKSK
ncbi:hypothetical protein AAZX31_04G004300 [Glycine max]